MPQSTDDKYGEADALWESGDLASARDAYLELLQESPNSAELHARVGDIWLKLGSPDIATVHFERSIRLDATLPWPHIGLGEIAEAAGSRKEALSHFKRALSAAPHLDLIIDRISRLRVRANRRQKGARAFDAETFRNRFRQANRLFDEHLHLEARQIYEELLEDDPGSAALLCKMGEISALYGDFDEAMSFYDRSEKSDAAFPWSHVGRAQILAARAAYDDAIECLNKALAVAPTLHFLHDQIAEFRTAQSIAQRRERPVAIRTWPSACEETAPPEVAARPGIAVVSWDLAHNPLGRAALLAELAARHGRTELIGALFPAFGTDLWEPVRGGLPGIPVRGYEAWDFAAFVEGAIRLVVDHPRDIIWVSKPRFPSLFIGFLYKLLHGAKVICDIDDDELAFVAADEEMTVPDFIRSSGPGDWRSPYTPRWTQLAGSMVSWADAVTVCNPVLQQKHGGTIVRHARDEAIFDPGLYDRSAIRAEFGFDDDDRVVLFLGTPRRHKGIVEIAEALAQISDPKAVLCIVGTLADTSLKDRLDEIGTIRKVLLPDQPLSRAAEINLVADVVCILQDPDSRISASQTPAKLTDALAMGATIIATPLPPIEDLIDGSEVVASGGADLVPTLKKMLSTRRKNSRNRKYFRQELSYAAHAKRVDMVLSEARGSQSGTPAGFLELLHHIGANMPGTLPDEVGRHLRGKMPVSPRAGKLRSTSKDLNVVFFWKQNDSQLFGRRQDMLVEALSKHPRTGKILHIDAPISAGHLASKSRQPSSLQANHDNFVAANAVARFLRTRDEDGVHRRTFVYDNAGEATMLGRELPGLDSFPMHVEKWMRELSMTDNTIAWVCPAVPEFPRVQERIGFSLVVSDVIDDQRQWPMKPVWRAEVEENYRRTFASSDIAIANCQPVADWLSAEGLEPLVVPNGLEMHEDVDSWPVPSDLAHLPRPIIGYAGNMTSRIDWSLIGEVARQRPDWTIVLIGLMPETEAVRAVSSLPNVRALGIIPYASAKRYLAAMDAAIIPHTRSEMSDSMNPLKLYVYRSLGVGVVATPVANMQDFRGDIRIAGTASEFVRQLEEVIVDRRHDGRSFPDAARLEQYSWDSRLARILARIDEVFGKRRRRPARAKARGR